MKNLVILSLSVIISFASMAQTCNDAITPTTPESRFTLHNDGTVTDKHTGLMWMRCSLGQSWNDNNCAGYASSYSWQNALNAAESENFAGYNDWLLPNIKQLNSIFELACYGPAINQHIFPATSSFSYWSSSPSANNNSAAWAVSFYDGGHNSDDFKNSNYHVRLVRGGQ